MAEELARDIVRESELLHRRNRPEMVATISLVPLPPNLVVPGLPRHSHPTAGQRGDDGETDQRQQRWFAVRGVEPGKTERTFLYAEEAISYAASHGFRRCRDEEEREWKDLLGNMNGRTGRDAGEPLLVLAKAE